MQEIIYENTMHRIKSVLDLSKYKVADLVIPLEELDLFLPEAVDQHMVITPSVNCIFSRDNITPAFIYDVNDKFLEKSNGVVTEVNPKDFEDISSLYIQSFKLKQQGFKSTVMNIRTIIGPQCSNSRSKKATRKIICYWLIDLWLKQNSLDHYEETSRNLPLLKEIYPPAVAENWWGQTIPLDFRSEDRPWLIDERLFENFLTRKLTRFPQIKDIDRFVDKDRDNFYYLDFYKENLVLTKGIDSKYLPYYREKFNVDVDNPT